MCISIIIPTLKDNFEYLKMTIESIKKYQKEQHEIIVVSNGGENYDIPINDIIHLHNEKQGQCGAVNLGVKNATCDYIYISDDDVVFPPNFEELIDRAEEDEYKFVSGNFMENEKKGGAAAPFVRNNCGETPETFDWVKFETDSMTMRENRWEKGFGFPLLCKKELWDIIGGYREELDPWGSGCDSDLEYSMMLRGITPMRWRGVVTYHFSQVSGTFWKPEALPFWDRNRRMFEQKWGIARANAPEIWFCDFKIPWANLRFKPSWAMLENNPNIDYEK